MVKTINGNESLYSKPFVRTLLALVCCCLWGCVIPALKIGYTLLSINSTDIPDMLVFAGVRFMLAGLLIIVFYSIQGKKILRPSVGQIRKLSLIGFVQTFCQSLFCYISISYLTGVKCSVITGSVSFFTILISCFVFRQERFTARKLISCVIGFSGILLANLNGLEFSFRWIAEGFCMLGMVFSATGNCIAKNYSREIPVSVLTSYDFLFGGIILSAIGLIVGGALVLESVGAVLILLFLSFLAASAQVVWTMLLKYNSVSKIAVFRFFVPIFGVIISSMTLTGEKASISILLALLLVCAGTVISNWSKRQKC